jgi:hypothetical protein
VSGSFPDTINTDERLYIEDVAREIGRAIAEQEKRMVSGFGLVVGGAAIAGAMEIILAEAAPNLEKSFMLRPFPQKAPKGINKVEFQKRYRESMIQQAGGCIFIAGLKAFGKRAPTIAEGVLEEFEVARSLGRPIFPIGATGGAARRIWEMLAEDAEFAPAGLTRKEFERLNETRLPPAEAAKLIGKGLRAPAKIGG